MNYKPIESIKNVCFSSIGQIPEKMIEKYFELILSFFIKQILEGPVTLPPSDFGGSLDDCDLGDTSYDCGDKEEWRTKMFPTLKKYVKYELFPKK